MPSLDGSLRLSLGKASAWRDKLHVLFAPAQGPGRLAVIGMFALVCVGIHAGADRLDDRAFVLIHFVDGLLDAVTAGFIRVVWGFFEVSPETIAAHQFAAVDWIDLDDKIREAKHVALLGELIAAFLLALPVLQLGRIEIPQGGLRGALTRSAKDPTLLRWTLPIAIVLAATAGAVAVTSELNAASYGLVFEVSDSKVAASWVARIVGVVTLVSSAWFLGARAFVRAVERADRIARNDTVRMIKPRQRRLRGAWTAVLALPVAFIAFIEGTPLLETVMSLLF